MVEVTVEAFADELLVFDGPCVVEDVPAWAKVAVVIFEDGLPILEIFGHIGEARKCRFYCRHQKGDGVKSCL